MSLQRADRLLVERGYFDSRAKAQAAIEAGLVTADGVPIRKASDRVPVAAAIVAEPLHPWVSRGGLKLAAALDAFGIDPAGLTCLDVGASTGGFSHVLLSRGAAKVYAVDVGHGQLHPTIAGDPRIVSLEKTDARALTRALIPSPIALAVVDVSFISLKHVLPPALPLLGEEARVVCLVKPQFEAGRAHVGKGVVRDEAIHRAVCEDLAAFVDALGFSVIGLISSPVVGGDGNREFLIGARRG